MSVKSIPIPNLPHLAKVWQRKGQPLKVPAAGEDQTFIVFGAVDYATGQVIWKVSERKGEKVAITSALLSAVYRDGAPERGASFKPVNPGH